MGFDLITLSMAKAYSDSKGGYVEKNWKTILSTEGQTIPFAVEDGFGSYETETNDGRELKQISNGDICKVVLDGTEYVLPAVVDSIDVYIGNSEGTEDGVPFLFWFTNMEGTWGITVEVMGEEPEHSFALYLQTETVHTIDPKYLPNTVVDFDKLNLTDVVMELFSSGGGNRMLNASDGADTETMCRAFPLDHEYVAKLTIPGMGVMLVNPVYTLADGDGDRFSVAHFDSYLRQDNGFMKFYVRVERATGGAYTSVEVFVGFY